MSRSRKREPKDKPVKIKKIYKEEEAEEDDNYDRREYDDIYRDE